MWLYVAVPDLMGLHANCCQGSHHICCFNNHNLWIAIDCELDKFLRHVLVYWYIRHYSVSVMLTGFNFSLFFLKICSLVVCRLSTHVTYSGLSFNMSTLYGNPFLNYFLLSAVELPAYTVSWLSACRLSRRLSFISFSLLGALALFLIQVTLHSEWDHYNLVLPRCTFLTLFVNIIINSSKQ